MQSASPSQWNHTSEGLVPDGWGRNGTCGVAGAVLAGSSGFHWSVHALGFITLALFVIAKQVLVIGSRLGPRALATFGARMVITLRIVTIASFEPRQHKPCLEEALG